MFTSGEIVSTFITKTGHEAVLRFAQISDAENLMEFINFFSLENRFTRFSGEQLTLEEEIRYLESEVKAINSGDAVKLFCFINQKIAGVCDIHRDTSLLTRKRHTGILGIIIGKDFRGQGIGEHIMKTTIDVAKAHISGLRMIKLDCFATNIPAISLYKKLGFQEVGRIPKSLLYKNEYIDEVIMTLSI